MYRWLGFVIAPAFLVALPTGIEGEAELTASGSHLEIKVGDRASLKWDKFSIGKGESVTFVQPGPNSIAINHVSGGESLLLGALRANGSIYLVNSSGITIGDRAVIQVGSFLASTLDGIGDSVERRYALKGSEGFIHNHGKISALHGDVLLVSPKIDNSGEITAESGAVTLAAGKDFLVFPKGARALIQVKTGDSEVHHSGRIEAENINLLSDGNLYSLAINQGGLVDAKVYKGEGGRIFMRADHAHIKGSVEAEKEVQISSLHTECHGSITAKESVQIGGGDMVYMHGSSRVMAPSIAINAQAHLHAKGALESGDISLISKGRLALGPHLHLAQGGKIHLGLSDLHLGENLGASHIIKLLEKGDVTLETTSSWLTVGHFDGSEKAALDSKALNKLTLKAPMENGSINVHGGLDLEGDIELFAKDITMGFEDHGGSFPITLRSRNGSISMNLGKEGILSLFDGRLHHHTLISADSGDISIHGDNSSLLMRAEGTTCERGFSLELHAGGMIGISGVDSSLIESAGHKSSVNLKAEGIALRSMDQLDLIASGKSSHIQIGAESAIGLSGDGFRAEALGEEASIALSADKMAFSLRDWQVQALGERSSVQLTAGALQLIAQGDISFNAIGLNSLTQIALTADGRSYICALGDMKFVGDSGESSIVGRGGKSGLVLYAARDMTFERQTLIERYEDDLFIEAGRDMIWRGSPRFITLSKEQPSVQLMGAAKGERRMQSVVLSDLFERIAQAKEEGSIHFSTLSDWLNSCSHVGQRPLELFDMSDPRLFPRPLVFDECTIHCAQESKARLDYSRIEHDLCHDLQHVGLIGKLAGSLRHAYLVRGQKTEPAPQSRPWKKWAGNEEGMQENEERLAVD